MIKLIYLSKQLIIKSPQFGDSDTTQLPRIENRSQLGCVNLNRDKDWPINRTLNVSGYIDDYDAAIKFLHDTASLDITYENYDGKKYSGYITTPNAPITEQSPGIYYISISFCILSEIISV